MQSTGSFLFRKGAIISWNKVGVHGSSCRTFAGRRSPATRKGAYPLTSARVGAACLQGHINQVYAGTLQACATCHQDPVYHAGLFGRQCQDCMIQARGYRRAITVDTFSPIIMAKVGGNLPHLPFSSARWFVTLSLHYKVVLAQSGL